MFNHFGKNDCGRALQVLVLLAVAICMGCADFQDHLEPAEVSIDQRHQHVTVIPEFSITGTDSLPDELRLEELHLSISEIRLLPITSRPRGVAYSTSSPIHLNFDVRNGEVTQFGDAFEFTEPGRYLVSIRLEPTSMDYSPSHLQDADSGKLPSLSISGHVAGTVQDEEEPGARGGEDEDGNPLPLPFDETQDESQEDDGKSDRPGITDSTQWTPFHYSSHRAVFYTFADVQLSAGEQFLSFSFDLRDWAADLLNPIKHAIQTRSLPHASSTQGGVDVTDPLDSSGHGAESLMRKGTVQVERVDEMPPPQPRGAEGKGEL